MKKQTVDELMAMAAKALCAAGMNPDRARISAKILVEADARGIHTHGLKNLEGYLRRLRAGGLKPEAAPRVEAEGPAWCRIDGDSGLGMVVSHFAMEQALRKAGQAGIGCAVVRNSCHFGAAGCYASMALAHDCIGWAICNDTPTVTVPGGRSPVLGSNPFAIAIPAGAERPILFDIATSTVAGGKVFAAAARGQKIPEGWIVDSAGRPTTNPDSFPQGSTLTPMSGHKGYGLALAIEILSGALSGAGMLDEILSWSFAPAGLATGHGALFMAWNIEAFLPAAEFKRRVDGVIQKIRNAPRAEGVSRILIPGEMEWENEARARLHGVELPEEIVQSLGRVMASAGAPGAGEPADRPAQA